MSLFGKIKDALKKTREGVSTKLRLLFAKNKLGEEFYDELEEILISADVSVRTAEEVVEEVKEEAIGGKVKDQAFVTDLLKDILEEKLEEAPVPEIKYPCVIMFVGVNGVGKTTTIGKVANYFVSQKKSVTVAAADTFRAAASDQLSVWAERANVRIVKHLVCQGAGDGRRPRRYGGAAARQGKSHEGASEDGPRRDARIPRGAVFEIFGARRDDGAERRLAGARLR